MAVTPNLGLIVNGNGNEHPLRSDFKGNFDKIDTAFGNFTSLPTNEKQSIVLAIKEIYDALKSVVDGSSGADFISMTPIAETGSANKVQTVIEALITLLKSVIDGNAGADLIGATAISDLDGTKVQALLESLRNKLKSTADSSSGADFVNATSIVDLDGTTVQALLESFRNKLKSISDGSSGADFIGATNINGLVGNTIQALLESLKQRVDTIITTPIDGTVAAQEIIDARGGKTTLDARLDDFDSQMAENATRNVYVDDYMLTGEDYTDASAFIQRAFDANNEGNINFIFKNGKTYELTEPVIFQRHKQCILTGNRAVIKVADSISESDPIDYMIDISAEAPPEYSEYNWGYLTISGINIDGNNRAIKLIQGVNPSDLTHTHGLVQTLIHNKSRFIGIREDGWGIYGVSWGTTIKDCEFLGYGTSSSNPGEWRGKALYISTDSNGINIHGNNFARLTQAIVCTTPSTRVNISRNIFDQVRKAPVNFNSSGYMPIIEENYFEKCASEADTVNVYPSTPVTTQSCIVLTGSPTTPQFPMQGAIIRKNSFASCYFADLVVADNIFGLRIEDNALMYMASPANSALKLLKYGVGYRDRRSDSGILIQNNTFEDFSGGSTPVKLITKIVDTTTLVESNIVDFGQLKGMSDIVIKQFTIADNGSFKQLPSNLLRKNFLTYKHTGSFSIYDVKREVVNNEIVYVFKLTSALTTSGSEITINPGYLNKLKGQYIRVNFKTAGSSSGNMIRFILTDGVKTITYLPFGNQTNKALTNEYLSMSILFYIDPSATALAFRVQTFAPVGQEIYIKDFSMAPAFYDTGSYEELPYDVHATSIPTTGNWYVGDKIMNNSPSPGGYVGWVCTTAGEFGVGNPILKGYGLIQA